MMNYITTYIQWPKPIQKKIPNKSNPLTLANPKLNTNRTKRRKQQKPRESDQLIQATKFKKLLIPSPSKNATKELITLKCIKDIYITLLL